MKKLIAALLTCSLLLLAQGTITFIATHPVAGGGPSFPAGAVIRYEFNDSSGQVLTDLSGNGNNGQLGDTSGSEASDPTWATEGGENYLDFALDTDWVEIPSAALSSQFTISILFHRDVTTDALELVTKTNGANRMLARTSFYNFIITSSTFNATGVATPAIDTWALVTYRRNAVDKVDLFINDGGATRLYSDVAQSGDHTIDYLGGGSSSTGLDGGIAFFAKYSTALTDSQIQDELYCAVRALKSGLGLPAGGC